MPDDLKGRRIRNRITGEQGIVLEWEDALALIKTDKGMVHFSTREDFDLDDSLPEPRIIADHLQRIVDDPSSSGHTEWLRYAVAYMRAQ